MFGMRITVWRNVKLHTSSFLRNSLLFSMMSYIQSVEVVTFASTLEKDWLLLMIGIFLALSVMLWIIDVGKNHFNFNVHEEYGICFSVCTYGNFLMFVFIHLIRGIFLLNNV